MKCYITFGQVHVHRINKHTLDKDCVMEFTSSSLEAGHREAMVFLDAKFHGCLASPPDMKYYPRGIINIDD